MTNIRQLNAALQEAEMQRRLRSQNFPSDPCWEMLLDLYDAHLQGAESS